MCVLSNHPAHAPLLFQLEGVAAHTCLWGSTTEDLRPGHFFPPSVSLIKIARLPHPLVSSFAHGSESFAFAKKELDLLLPYPSHLLESFWGISEQLCEKPNYVVLPANTCYWLRIKGLVLFLSTCAAL